MLEHDLVSVSDIVLLDIVHEDFSLLRVLLEVLLESLVAEELLLELIYLLKLDSLVVKSPRHVFNSRLNLEKLLPHDWNAFDHVVHTECLIELSLVKFKLLLIILGMDEGEDCSIIELNVACCLLVLVVLGWGVKVKNVGDVLELRLD